MQVVLQLLLLLLPLRQTSNVVCLLPPTDNRDPVMYSILLILLLVCTTPCPIDLVSDRKFFLFLLVLLWSAESCIWSITVTWLGMAINLLGWQTHPIPQCIEEQFPKCHSMFFLPSYAIQTSAQQNLPLLLFLYLLLSKITLASEVYVTVS